MCVCVRARVCGNAKWAQEMVRVSTILQDPPLSFSHTHTPTCEGPQLCPAGHRWCYLESGWLPANAPRALLLAVAALPNAAAPGAGAATGDGMVGILTRAHFFLKPDYLLQHRCTVLCRTGTYLSLPPQTVTEHIPSLEARLSAA